MPLPDEYANNVGDIGFEKAVSFEAKFAQYITEHGIERAQGYLDGLIEMQNVITRLNYAPADRVTEEPEYIPRPMTRVHKLLSNFIKQNIYLIDHCQAELDTRKPSNSGPEQKT